MSHILADRVLESTTTTGTGALTLAGAVTGFRRFSAVCAVSDTVPYFIEAVDSLGQPTGDYEYGTGTYSGANTLTRTTVSGSSNAGAAVNFAAGSKNVGIALQASSLQGVFSTSSYMRHPCGALEQWGELSVDPGSSGGTAVVFPVAFTSTPQVYTQLYDTLTSTQSVNVTNRTVNGFTAGTTYVSPLTVSWRAIGR